MKATNNAGATPARRRSIGRVADDRQDRTGVFWKFLQVTQEAYAEDFPGGCPPGESLQAPGQLKVQEQELSAGSAGE